MASIVLGIGCSHTPQISSPVSLWPDHAARDMRNTSLLAADGELYNYDQVLANASGDLDGELTVDAMEAKLRRANAAIDTLAEKLAEVRPDVVLVVGDDQNELFDQGLIPAVSLYLGDELTDVSPTGAKLEKIPLGIKSAMWARHAEARDAYPVDGALSKFLAESLTSAGFEIAQMLSQPEDRSLGLPLRLFAGG